jgi:S-formylglutathione hydrolase FrmB
MTARGRGLGGLLAAVMVAVSVSSCQAASPAGPAPVTWKKFVVQSPSTGKIERFWVGHASVIKSGPAAAGDPTYPVIYFLPGLLDSDDNWKNALDPVLSKFGVIAVCPAVGGATWFMNSPAQPWMKWGDYLAGDLRAFVESHFPASTEKGQRGLCGISAGAHGAFYQALLHPDLYGSVSVISGAMDLRGYMGVTGLQFWIGPRSPETAPLYADRSCVVLAERHQGPLPFDLYLDSGDSDGAKPQMEAFKKVLDAKEYPYKWFVGKGGHSWDYWNTRAQDHVAWHANLFARNLKEGRFNQKPPAGAPELKVLEKLPEAKLSEKALGRLTAPWTPLVRSGRLPVEGLPKDGGPLSKTDPKYKEVLVTGALAASGDTPGLFACRLTATVGTPQGREGTVSIGTAVRTERNRSILHIASTPLTLAAGQADRRVEFHLRMVLELAAPDPIRGGIVAGIQVFDDAGKPVGDPVIARADPGSWEVEGWPIIPAAKAEWSFMLLGDKALDLAAVYDFRVEAEP